MLMCEPSIAHRVQATLVIWSKPCKGHLCVLGSAGKTVKNVQDKGLLGCQTAPLVIDCLMPEEPTVVL